MFEMLLSLLFSYFQLTVTVAIIPLVFKKPKEAKKVFLLMWRPIWLFAFWLIEQTATIVLPYLAKQLLKMTKIFVKKIKQYKQNKLTK